MEDPGFCSIHVSIRKGIVLRFINVKLSSIQRNTVYFCGRTGFSTHFFLSCMFLWIRLCVRCCFLASKDNQLGKQLAFSHSQISIGADDSFPPPPLLQHHQHSPGTCVWRHSPTWRITRLLISSTKRCNSFSFVQPWPQVGRTCR